MSSPVVERLLAAYDQAAIVPLITQADAGFDVAAAYGVLAEIEAHRRAQGWQPVGRKVGFTNRTIWDRYGVDRPMWARMWSRTQHLTTDGGATLELASLVQPRIEPEVVFKLRAPVPVTDDPQLVLASVEWIAAGFEIVQCHFADWRFTAADCTADFGLHGGLVVGRPLPVTPMNRGALAAALGAFTATLRRGGHSVESAPSANVLGHPALVLSHLSGLLATQPAFDPLGPGEIITTGTITDAWAIRPGETWSSDYGTLGVEGLTVSFV
jgi:2-oxo-3-hexenedioate decarboxylase